MSKTKAGAPAPEEVVDDWMQSPGHRRNILEAAFIHAGVGHAFRDPDRGRLQFRHYWTLLLGAPERDDVAVETSTYSTGRRGVAGTLHDARRREKVDHGDGNTSSCPPLWKAWLASGLRHS